MTDFERYILYLLAPMLEKARKWDELINLSESNYNTACGECSFNDICKDDKSCSYARVIVDMLAGKEDGDG